MQYVSVIADSLVVCLAGLCVSPIRLIPYGTDLPLPFGLE